jgi:hypothetical protein
VASGDLRTSKATEFEMTSFIYIHQSFGKEELGAAVEKALSFDLPVVYLTAYADEDTLSRAKVTGPYGYIMATLLSPLMRLGCAPPLSWPSTSMGWRGS